MKKIFLPYNISGLTSDSTVVINGDDHNHIANSLRSKVGEQFIIGDCDGHEFVCRVSAISRSETVLAVQSPYVRENDDMPETILCFALLKGDKNEEIIKRCTEIGVRRFIPVAMHNCVMRVDNKSAVSKTARWQQIAREASMQSGARFIPIIDPVIDMAQLCRLDLPKQRYFGQILSHTPITDILSKNNGTPTAVIIGPEGDFTADEETMLRNSGWIGVTCPTNVMRSETAAIYFASIMSVRK